MRENEPAKTVMDVNWFYVDLAVPYLGSVRWAGAQELGKMLIDVKRACNLHKNVLLDPSKCPIPNNDRWSAKKKARKCGVADG